MDASLLQVLNIDLPTVIGFVGVAFFLAAVLLLLSWLQQPDLAPLSLWSLGFGLAAAGALLIAARGHIPDFWSIVVANALLAAAYGALWSGARRLDGRPALAGWALAGVAVWLVAMLVPEIHGDLRSRVALKVATGVTYTLLTAFELWRSRGDGLPSRWPAIVVLLIHAAALPVRLTLAADWLENPEPSHSSLFAFAIFESILLAMAGTYLFGSLVREKVAASYRWAASVDALTGVANRRAFLQAGVRLMQRASVEGREMSVLLFDIDHFKTVNDAYGHAAGDSVLKTFCDVAQAQIRPADLFARIGGEEFACLLFDAGAADAALVAERVRWAFEGAQHTSEERSFGATVSVGIATARASQQELPELLASADRALYRAKRAGRNRIEADTSEASLGGSVLRVVHGA